MSAQGYAEFLKSIGHHVLKDKDVYWFNSHSRIYMSFPFTHEIDPRQINTAAIFNHKGVVVRHPCPLNMGRNSFKITVNNPDYDLTTLSAKSRNQTRRGLENCEIRELSRQELLEHAPELNRETLNRQGRLLTEKQQQYWDNYYQKIVVAEGATAWGAYVRNELAAFLISFNMGDCENILIVRSKTALLKYYPNNALIYDFVYQKMRSPGVNEISIGLESIQADMESLDKFKTGMGFKKVPIGQCVAFHPWIARFLSPLTLKILKRSLLPFAHNKESLAKLYGLLDWYGEQEGFN